MHIELMNTLNQKPKIKFNPTNSQIIILTFLTIIIIGAFLLALPFSSRYGSWTSPLDSIFTAASALCVTGLVVVDTYTHWSLFGQIVILCLIQIGGIGFMTIATMFSIFLGRKIGLAERQLIMQASGMLYMGGVVDILKKIILCAFLFQGIGMLLLSLRFIPMMGLGTGLYYSLFHSISAFCNAGFDLFRFSSLSSFADDPLVLLTIFALYTIGGLGFLVWNDVFKNRINFKKYTLHTKIALTVTGFLLLVSFLSFFLLERNHSMADMSMPVRLLNSVFVSSMPRSPGFSTFYVKELSESGILLTMMLMLVGGSPGSTAGGLKTTTLLVILLSAASMSRKNKHVAVFNRRLTDDTIRNANALFVIYIGIVIIATILISAIEPFSLTEVIFEVISALGTVGLSMGITSDMGPFARIIIAVLMFAGRAGFITLIMALHGRRIENAQERVQEKILIG